MISTLYIEEAVREHPRSREICARFPHARQILCAHYGELFNRKAQHFRLQKQGPALILARKQQRFLLPAPPQYGIGGSHNYYFSHMLNCLYDCRYCFLQGMYRSANYVLFVNYEDFQQAIHAQARDLADADPYFYSGYDCDSLALDPVTRFCGEFLPLFKKLPHCRIELRTKSTQIRALLHMEPLPNCIVAFSFTPETIRRKLEHGVPSVARRLDAMEKLYRRGWQLGLRFDPLIYQQGFEHDYQALFAMIFARIPATALHSVSLGGFRMPEKFFRTLGRLYPDEAFLAGPFVAQKGMVAYRQELETRMMDFCSAQLLSYIPHDKFFPCSNAST